MAHIVKKEDVYTKLSFQVRICPRNHSKRSKVAMLLHIAYTVKKLVVVSNMLEVFRFDFEVLF